MRICWDEKRIGGIEDRLDRVEKKVDDGFAETRADFRMILGIVLAMFLTMILGFASIVAGILLQAS
jgi:hypothetical protein